MSEMQLLWQPTLFSATDAAEIDPEFAALDRHPLDTASWVDYAPGWVGNADALFAELVEGRPWGQRTRPMFDRHVLEPRLTSSWSSAGGLPLEPPVIERMRAALSARYGL